jgi:hypothetical protein
MSEYEVMILAALDERGAFRTGQIAKSFASPCNRSVREHSSDVRVWLLDMRERGLVKPLDREKPVCWVRTPLGSATLRRLQR